MLRFDDGNDNTILVRKDSIKKVSADIKLNKTQFSLIIKLYDDNNIDNITLSYIGSKEHLIKLKEKILKPFGENIEAINFDLL